VTRGFEAHPRLFERRPFEPQPAKEKFPNKVLRVKDAKSTKPLGTTYLCPVDFVKGHGCRLEGGVNRRFKTFTSSLTNVE
jgi:hypothetical protein